MQDVNTMLARISRPKALMQAGKIAANSYRRDRHLAPLIGGHEGLGAGARLVQLIDSEREVNHQRCAQHPEYSMLRHIDLLAALIAEARCLNQPLSNVSALV